LRRLTTASAQVLRLSERFLISTLLLCFNFFSSYLILKSTSCD